MFQREDTSFECAWCKHRSTNENRTMQDPTKKFCSLECLMKFEDEEASKLTTKYILGVYNMTLDCESPFEISSNNGDVATGTFAEMIVEDLRTIVFYSELAYKELEPEHKEAIKEIPISDFTCHGCAMAYNCMFAYDPYNRQGDCLAEK